MGKLIRKDLVNRLIIALQSSLLISAVYFSDQNTFYAQVVAEPTVGQMKIEEFFLPNEDNYPFTNETYFGSDYVYHRGEIRFNVSLYPSSSSKVGVINTAFFWDKPVNITLTPGESYQEELTATGCYDCYISIGLCLFLVDPSGNASGICWSEILKTGRLGHRIAIPFVISLSLYWCFSDIDPIGS